MRRVTDSDGASWTVDVSWTDRRFGTHLHRFRARRRNRDRNAGRASDQPEKESGWDWLNLGDFFVGDVEVIVVIAIIVALFVAAVFLFPWLPVLLLDGAELLVFPVIAAAVIAWRVMRRRPFTVTAACDRAVGGEWKVLGVRAARRIERAVADAIEAGDDVTRLFPELATASDEPHAD